MYFISDYATQLYDGNEAKYNTTLQVTLYKKTWFKQRRGMTLSKSSNQRRCSTYTPKYTSIFSSFIFPIFLCLFLFFYFAAHRSFLPLCSYFVLFTRIFLPICFLCIFLTTSSNVTHSQHSSICCKPRHHTRAKHFDVSVRIW